MTGMSRNADVIASGTPKAWPAPGILASTMSCSSATDRTPAWTIQNRTERTGGKKVRRARSAAPAGWASLTVVIGEGHQLGGDCLHDGLGAGSDSELVVDVVAMPFHRPPADPKAGGDLLVVQPLGEQLQDGPLSLGELGGPGGDAVAARQQMC